MNNAVDFINKDDVRQAYRKPGFKYCIHFVNGLNLFNTQISLTPNFKLKSLSKHNLYVKSVVPKEDLLVWNLKDGWEPLCTFLGKEIPNEPIPHDNKTGDVEFLRNYAYRTNIYAIGIRNLVKNLLILLAKFFFGLYLVNCYIKKRAD